MCIALFVQTADNHLGRVDFASLSDQTLMEMLVEGFSERIKKKFQDKNGMFRDACEWKGVKCDGENNVTAIKKIARRAPISLEYIPLNVKLFEMYTAELTGTLETSGLPRHLERFAIGGNGFTGTVNFPEFPRDLQLISLYLNKFSGSAILDVLPRSLETLAFQKNNFSGSLCLTNIPPRLKHINASGNVFTGDFILQSVPNDETDIKASENCFSPTSVVSKSICRLFLCKSGVTSVVDEEGNTHSKEAEILGRHC